MFEAANMADKVVVNASVFLYDNDASFNAGQLSWVEKKAVVLISAELFPQADFEKAKFWMGSRPSMPDSVPVISKPALKERIFYNCGYGYYGLSFAASSARIVGDLISGENIDDAYQYYSIQRF
jgi:D-amino-acid dehydrogenase